MTTKHKRRQIGLQIGVGTVQERERERERITSHDLSINLPVFLQLTSPQGLTSANKEQKKSHKCLISLNETCKQNCFFVGET